MTSIVNRQSSISNPYRFAARLLTLALLISNRAVPAQSSEATISGVVTDAQGAAIEGAAVTATDACTGVKTRARSNESGFYSLRFLPIGEYVITVEYPGFRRYFREGVILTTGQVLGLDISLQLGAVSQSVNVTAAASTLETRTSDVGQLVDNVFGGTVGGPVRRDKTFFFCSYEGSRRRDGFTRTLTVPTVLERSGDFSQTFDAQGRLIRIHDPATTITQNGHTTRLPFAGNRIPQNRMDPVALNLLQFYPLPNRAPDNITGANNFRSNYVTALTRNNYLVKIDHNLGSKDKLSGRYLYNSDDIANTSVFPAPAAETMIDAVRHQHYYYASWTRVISPALVNELRFTYGTRINHQLTKGLGGGWPSTIGIRGVPDDAFPEFVVAGVTTIGSNQQERRQYPIQQYQWVENLSWVRGRHSFKFGGEVRPSYNYEVNLPTVSGSFNFGTQATGLPGSAGTGNGFASLLLGFANSFTARQTEILDRHSWYLAAFAQDDWTVRKDLTLNIGLRWETDTPIVDVNHRMNGFDPNAINPVSGTPGVVRFAGVNGWRTKPYSTDVNNFGPRFGFAWKVFGSQKTVVRGGSASSTPIHLTAVSQPPLRWGSSYRRT